MFTGLIEAICTVKSAYKSDGGMRLTIDLGNLAGQCQVGDSIAVNGVCLTIAQLRGNLAEFDVSGETLTKSTLGKVKSSSPVNAELALKAADRFGGHFVLGHVDGTAAIKAVDMQGQFVDIKFSANPALLDQMVVKGSVAVDGISLTIANMDEDGFSVSIIPQTLKKTTLGTAKIGDMVNIETDIIIKTIRSTIDKILPREQKLTIEKLKEMGF